MTLKHVSLFAGIGGLDLAAHAAGFATRLLCEKDPHCQKVLRRHFPTVPIIEDVREVTGDLVRAACGGRPTVVSAGFPCQPFSSAGKRKGVSDDRFLWPEVVRVLRESEPEWFVGENVRGLLSIDSGRTFGGILADLADMGFRVGWSCFGADEAAGASHRRDRVFIVGFLASEGFPRVATLSAGEGSSPVLRGTTAAGQGCDCTRSMGDSQRSERGRGRGEMDQSQGQRSFNAQTATGRPIDDMADPSRNDGDRSHGETGRGRRVCGTSDERAYSRLRPGSAEQGLELEERDARAGEPGGSMADASGSRREGADVAIESGRRRTSGQCSELADSSIDHGRSGVSGAEAGTGTAGLGRRRLASRDGMFPPGPDDLDRWRDVALSDPSLLPALSREAETELEVRAVAHGVPGALAGLTRRQRLKMLGNAVVPAQAFCIFDEIAAIASREERVA